MKTIKIDEIHIQSRQRGTFNEEALARLSESIQNIGLLHAPVLDNGRLVAGERRVRAIRILSAMGVPVKYQGEELPLGEAPYTELGSSDPLSLMEAELEENLIRENLTMAEENAAKAELHRLRELQNPGQTKTDTARELTEQGNVTTPTDVRNALLIDEHLDDPDVAKAKTSKEAIKIIAKKKQEEKNKELARIFEQNKESMQENDEHLHSLHCGDMVAVMAGYQEDSFDVILTDPPYGIDAQEFNAQEGVTHNYNDTRENFERIIDTIAIQGNRVCRRDAHAYIFLDFENWGYVRRRMEAAGWDVWPRPIIWNKGNGLLARPDYGPRYTHEYILYAIKGDRKVTQVAPDVINIRTLTKQRRGAEKPSSLYLDLLRRSVRPGDKVLDPCCGLGAIFPAANTLSCIAHGIEIDNAAVGYASERLTINVEEDESRREAEDLMEAIA